MSVLAECGDCGKTYKLSDDKAGSRIRCPNCRGVIDVPDGEDQYNAPQKRGASKKGKSRRSTSGSGNMVLLVGVGGAVGLLMLGGIFAAILVFRGAGEAAPEVAKDGTDPIPVAATDQSTIESAGGSAEPAAPVLSAEEQERRTAAYKESIERQRQNQGGGTRDSLVTDFGAEKVVTVTFVNVAGETADVDKYLNRKVFRAAYKDYAEGAERARQLTEANRKQAEQEAVQNAPGAMMVWYHYRRVESDVPYPRVIAGGRSGDRMTYHVGPAINPQAFAERLAVGQVSQVSGRDIEVTVYLPVPVPDPDVEDLMVAYGQEQVLTIQVSGANGDPKAVKIYLEDETKKAAPDEKFSFVAMKEQGDGEFQFTIGPVIGYRNFADKLTWGEVISHDPDTNTLKMQAKLPADLPSYEELVEARKEKERLEKAIRDADWARRPRPNETELEWAIRVLKDSVPFAEENALKALAIMDIEEGRREEVSKLLSIKAQETTWHLGEYVTAILHWKTDDTEKVILSLGGEKTRMHADQRKAVMAALVELGSEKCAKALASGLPDFFAGEDTVPFLIEMGAIAEDPVLQFLKSEDEKVRRRVYEILTEIGTSKSLSKVRGNVRLERNEVMKALAEECADSILERVNAAKDAPAEKENEKS